ncbi:NADP-dependent oxidoreductase [Kitasatospora sp. NPDC093806]|uniref:NADP-dependent oxidoreductase n=1 Tax=Kitasatospora sp. NPDC093806 TaxID=3155075 RepID=UPI003430EE81
MGQSTATMHAVRLHAFGGPEVLVHEEVPRPAPGPGEVLIRVHAAGFNPLDLHVRDGFSAIPAELRPVWTPPLTPGTDVSGVVAEVGEGVTAWRPGDEVFGLIRFPGKGAGYAEYTVAPAEHLAAKPAALSHDEAAAVPLAALTAHQFLRRLGPRRGGTVLVNGAAGGVGHFTVQLARSAGADRVLAVASGRHEEFLRGLGVDRFIDYTRTPVAEAVHAEADVLIDAVGGPEAHRLLPVVRPGGRIVPVYFGDYRREEAARLGVTVEEGWQVRSSGADLAELAVLLDEGRLQVHLDSIHPLAEAAAAHRRAEQGHVRGKIVLTVRP